MKRLKKIIATVAVCSMAISAIGCNMIEKTPEAIQKTVLAEIGSEKITKADMDEQMKQLNEQLKQMYGEDFENNSQIKEQLKQQRLQYLNAMVNEKIMLQEAEKNEDLRQSDEETQKEVEDMISQYKSQYSNEDDFNKLLSDNGFTEDSFKEYQTEQSKIRYVYQKITADATVSDEDIENYYNENKETNFTEGAGATVAHILVDDEETAKDIKAQLDAGADFATLAKEKSKDTGTAQNGGSLGFVPYNSTQFVQEFMDGFKDLKEGEVSEPVKSQYGYHIIKATDLKEANVTPLDEVKDQIKMQLEQKKQSDAFTSKIEEWKKDLNVKVYEDRIK